MGEKGEGSGGDGGGKWGEWGRELGMWYPPVHPLITRLAFMYCPNGKEMDQMVRNDIACNCIPIVRIAFRYAHISFHLLF